MEISRAGSHACIQGRNGFDVVIENVWEYLRGNKLAITVLENYDDIVDKSCAAWRFFADDPERVEATGLSPCRAGPPKLLAVPFLFFFGEAAFRSAKA
jgi:hypothetical protein